MSYQVLARKWRPKNFQEMVGQEHVLTALVNALDHNRLHHAYLFTGTRGVGKTTIARVLAKCLNCETGVSSNPCGVCASCREISEGRFVDLIEVDAASRTKVEDTRELLDNVQYAPTRGRYKVYLIDEVHMLSGHSFNALLKTLEEPPPHVKFLLATTDPQKLPVTVLSRCLQFHLKNMSQDRIVGHLASVLGQENIGFEEPALWSLARAADGSMRDALSLTDQAIAFGNGKVAETQVNVMLGTIDQTFIHDILNALASLDAGKLLAAVANMAEQSPDYAGALADIIETLHRVAIAQTLPDALDNSRGDRDQVLVLAKSIASQDVQLFYQMALHGRRDLPLSPDPRAGFEMTLLRMLAFKPQGVTEIPKQSLPQSNMPNAGAPVQPDVPQTQAQKAPAPSSDAQSLAPETEHDQKPAAPEPEPEAPDAQQLAAAESAPPQQQAQPVPTEQNPPPIHSEDEYFASTQMAQADEPAAQLSHSEAKAGAIPEATASPPKPEPLATEAPVKAASGAASMLENFDTLQAPAADQDQPPANTHEANTGSHQKSAEQGSNERVRPKTKRPLEQLTRESWLDIYPDIGATGVLQSTISNCVFDNRDDSVVKFTLDQANATLYSDGHQARFAELLSTYFGQDLAVKISLGTVASETPASRAIRHRQERHAQAVQMVTSDPLIQAMVETFAITIDPDQIEPV